VNIDKKNTKPWLIGGGGDDGPLRGNGIPIYLTLPNSSIRDGPPRSCMSVWQGH